MNAIILFTIFILPVLVVTWFLPPFVEDLVDMIEKIKEL